MEEEKKGIPWQVMMGLFIVGIAAMTLFCIYLQKQHDYTEKNGVYFEAKCIEKSMGDTTDPDGTGNFSYTYYFEVTKPEDKKGIQFYKVAEDHEYKKGQIYCGKAAFDRNFFIIEKEGGK